MRTVRSSGHELLRLLAEIATPVYLLDEDRRITFLNQAAGTWLGVSPDELIGRQCRYQSAAAEPLSAMADLLCPPPEVFHGQQTSGVICRTSLDGKIEQLPADFIPLFADADRLAGVLVVIRHASASIAIETPDESRLLHELLLRIRREAAHRYQFDRLIGRSAAMARVREQIKLAAAGNGAVLIVGPPGIGRQHVARTIHTAGNFHNDTAKADAPLNHNGLTVVSCSALHSELLRSTLAAVQNRFKATNSPSGTLLLTDVDRLLADLHSELAQLLDTGPQNLRVISTARERLETLVARGTFPAELAQRLSTLVIDLPPLTERREDIPLLAQSFLEDLNSQGGKQLRGFASDAMDRLALYDWPGQVDELSALVREAFGQAEGFEIKSQDLSKKLQFAAEAARYPRPAPEIIDLEKFLTQVEMKLIQRALQQAKGNKSQAARLLGITRPRLYRRMVQLGLAAAGEE